jgi:hypothetical protein
VVEKGIDSAMVESIAEWGSEHVNLGLLSRRTLSHGLSLLLGQEPCDAQPRDSTAGSGGRAWRGVSNMQLLLTPKK